MAREPEAVAAFIDECELARGGDHNLDNHLDRLKTTMKAVADADDPQFLARRAAEDLAVGRRASLLVRHSPGFVADAYCAGRLGQDRSRGYGTLPASIDANAIIERTLPA